MPWNASVLTTVSSDTEPTVVITFDSAKYIFNVGENTTRAFLQSRQNWRKTRAVFVSSVGTQRASGLPGFLMTLADAGQPQLQITGPSGLLHLIASMRKYTYRSNFVVNPTEVPLTLPLAETSDQSVYQDDNISVFALPIVPLETSLQDTTPQNGTAITLKRKRQESPQPPSKRFSDGHPADSFTNDAPCATELLRKTSPAIDFDPTSLRGEAAQAWRQVVIQSMFPASGQSDTGAPQVSHQASGPNSNASARGLSTVSRVRLPKFSKPLPVPERTLVGSCDPALKPTVAYAVVGPRMRGKFDARKAAELGLPSGPLRAKLAKGDNVTVQVKDDDGKVVDRVIKPEDCIGESIAAAVVLLFDTPTLAHIPALLSGFANTGHFSKYLWKHAEGSKQYQVRAMFHLCGDGVLEDERYKTFMNDFGPEVHHIVASRGYLPNPITFTSAAYSQLRLNQLDPNIFPVQKYSCSPDQSITDVQGLPSQVTAMQKNLAISLYPLRPPLLDPEAGKDDLFHPVACSASTLNLPESTRSCFADAQSCVARAEVNKTCGGDVIVCPLGTNSAMPSKYRNVSATLIHIPDYGYILLDSGEGTWGQLSRKFGDDPMLTSSVWHVLRRLKCIFISHIHADHHIGLAKILAMRQRLDPPCLTPLYVIGNDNVFLYLHEYATLEELGLSPDSRNPVVSISMDAIHWRNDFSSPRSEGVSPRFGPAYRDMCTALGLESFRSVDVTHQTTCHGAIMKHVDGWSIVYSGDTIPTQKLVHAGEDATLLIHESTMADDEANLAAAKMHSTVSQAIDIGKRMKARNILLTHFSARYPKVPPSVGTERSLGDPIVALAFDHANIKISEMWKMNVYLEAIQQSFADLEDENGDTVKTEVNL